ncbi:MAG: glycosyltransferase family 39 protein, partial [Fibrobacteres bacterium]|nr:glycosyltransferase family 39 protein [Fibrobacterota bacterium]
MKVISVPDSKIVLTVFAAIFLVLFQIFSPLYPVFQESASFLAGMKYFSLTDGAPDAPGHYFYTVALRWSSSIAGDGFEGMLLLNRLFALVSLWSVYRAARFLHGKTAGFLAALVFVLHPFIIISAVAGDPAFASVAVYSLGAYLAIRTIRDPDPVGLFRFSLLTGIAGGFSLTAFIALLPLWTVLAYRTKDRHDPLSASVLVLLAGIALWLLPSVSAAGGLSELIRLLSNGPSWRATDIASHIVEYA